MIYLQRSKVLGAMEDHQQDQERKDFHWVQENLFDISEKHGSSVSENKS